MRSAIISLMTVFAFSHAAFADVIAVAPIDAADCKAMADALYGQYRSQISKPKLSHTDIGAYHYAVNNPADAKRDRFGGVFYPGPAHYYVLQGNSCHLTFSSQQNQVDPYPERFFLQSGYDTSVYGADGCGLSGGSTGLAGATSLCMIQYIGECIACDKCEDGGCSNDDEEETCKKTQWNYTIDCFKRPAIFNAPSQQP